MYLLRVCWFRIAVVVKEIQNEFVGFFYTLSVQYDMCRDFHILVRDTYQAGKREVFRQSPQISGIQLIDRLDHLFYVRGIHFDGRELFYPEKVYRSCGFLFPDVPDDFRSDRAHVLTGCDRA